MQVFQLFTEPLTGPSITMKFAVVFLLGLVAFTSAGPVSEDKRFIVDTFQDIGHWFSHVWDSAKNEFNTIVASVGHSINFDDVVKKLIPLIDSSTTEAACTAVCTGSFASVLGPAAPLAGALCGPVCKAALAELQKVAG